MSEHTTPPDGAPAEPPGWSAVARHGATTKAVLGYGPGHAPAVPRGGAGGNDALNADGVDDCPHGPGCQHDPARRADDYTRTLLAEQRPAVAYLLYFPAMRETARRCGYALAIHGSLHRDFDLVAVPWTGDAVDAVGLVAAICTDNALVVAVEDRGDKPHGRRTWTLKGVAGLPHGWVDLSVMPRVAP